jgi:hypothetical protein
MERADTGHAKADQVRMARDVTTMFDELKVMANRQVELHADRVQLQADVDRLAAELEQAVMVAMVAGPLGPHDRS